MADITTFFHQEVIGLGLHSSQIDDPSNQTHSGGIGIINEFNDATKTIFTLITNVGFDERPLTVGKNPTSTVVSKDKKDYLYLLNQENFSHLQNTFHRTLEDLMGRVKGLVQKNLREKSEKNISGEFTYTSHIERAITILNTKVEGMEGLFRKMASKRKRKPVPLKKQRSSTRSPSGIKSFSRSTRQTQPWTFRTKATPPPKTPQSMKIKSLRRLRAVLGKKPTNINWECLPRSTTAKTTLKKPQEGSATSTG
jgi:hypothetical protein